MDKQTERPTPVKSLPSGHKPLSNVIHFGTDYSENSINGHRLNTASADKTKELLQVYGIYGQSPAPTPYYPQPPTPYGTYVTSTAKPVHYSPPVSVSYSKVKIMTPKPPTTSPPPPQTLNPVTPVISLPKTRHIYQTTLAPPPINPTIKPHSYTTPAPRYANF